MKIRKGMSTRSGMETSEGRKAAVPLYVMLDQERMDRYKAAADAAGMNMREYVTNALDAQLAQQSEPDLVGGSESDPGWANRRLNAHALRLGTLEKTVEALQRRVDTQWGEDRDPVRTTDLVSLDDPSEIRYWTKRLIASERVIRTAIAKVGRDRVAVEEYLGRK